MTPKVHLFLLLVVCASCFLTGSEGSPFAARKKRQLETALSAVDNVANNVGGAIGDVAYVPVNTIYQILRLITSPLRGIFGVVTAPIRFVYHGLDGIFGPLFSIVGGFFHPFRALAGNLILSLGDGLHAVVPPLGNILKLVTEPLGDTIYPGSVESSSEESNRRRRDLSVRDKRGIADSLSGILAEIMNMTEESMNYMMGLSMNMIMQASIEGFSVACRVVGPYYEKWTTVPIDCDQVTEQLKLNPIQTLISLGSNIFNAASEMLAKGILAGMAMAWTFFTDKLLPMLTEEIMELKQEGALPESISSMIDTINSLYSIGHMFGLF